jgi:hypothetical protein
MSKFNQKDITKIISNALGFNTKAELVKFINDENINVKSMSGFNEFENTVLKIQLKKQREVQLQQLNEIHRLRKQVMATRKQQENDLQLITKAIYTVAFIAYSIYNPDQDEHVRATDIITDAEGIRYKEKDMSVK